MRYLKKKWLSKIRIKSKVYDNNIINNFLKQKEASNLNWDHKLYISKNKFFKRNDNQNLCFFNLKGRSYNRTFCQSRWSLKKHINEAHINNIKKYSW